MLRHDLRRGRRRGRRSSSSPAETNADDHGRDPPRSRDLPRHSPRSSRTHAAGPGRHRSTTISSRELRPATSSTAATWAAARFMRRDLTRSPSSRPSSRPPPSRISSYAPSARLRRRRRVRRDAPACPGPTPSCLGSLFGPVVDRPTTGSRGSSRDPPRRQDEASAAGRFAAAGAVRDRAGQRSRSRLEISTDLYGVVAEQYGALDRSRGTRHGGVRAVTGLATGSRSRRPEARPDRSRSAASSGESAPAPCPSRARPRMTLPRFSWRRAMS